MLALDLTGLRAVVVGGGPVAARRVGVLLSAGARVRVVSPRLTNALQELHRQGRIEVALRPYQPGDTGGALLVVAATGDARVDGAIAAEALTHERLVNVAGAPEAGNVQFPAQIQRGRVEIGVVTGGASPTLAKQVKSRIEEAVGPEFGTLADLLAEARGQLKAVPELTQPDRVRIFEGILQGSAYQLITEGRVAEAREIIQRALTNAIQKR